MKRLVLVHRTSNRICGDTSAPGPLAPVWTMIAAHFNDNVAVLAASAARLLDLSLGTPTRNYVFTPFAADRTSDGYLIFDCASGGVEPPCMNERLNQEGGLSSCLTGCPYMGYVRRDR